MPATVTSGRSLRLGLLHLGTLGVLLLAGFTARSVWLAWNARTGDARAAAVFALVEQRTAPRPTEAPGAMAWLRLQLERYAAQGPDEDSRARGQRLLDYDGAVPQDVDTLAAAMREALADGGAPPDVRADGPLAGPTGLRVQQVLAVGGHRAVATYRPSPASGSVTPRTVTAWLPALDRGASAVARVLASGSLPGVGSGPARPVRLYAVVDDGTLVSVPLADGGADVVAREAAHLAARPGLPAFAPQEFFFRFEPSAPPGRAAYSGLYLDLAGRGLVSTLLMTLPPVDGMHAVLALDLAFAMDWAAFARGLEPPVVATTVKVADLGTSPWTAVAAALDDRAPASLRRVADAVRSREREGATPAQPSPVHHAVAGSLGALASFQVADGEWLVAWFPRTVPAFPVGTVVLLAVLSTALLAGFELTRRRAEGERLRAESALSEKQNLLNTMQVPLIVVDPNSDELVSSNRAAEALGLRPGARFADFVAPTDDARAHYGKMQVASAAPRRAYGVPMVVADERGTPETRYAIVRSVAVTAPIPALAADERHRLGVLFLVEPEADLALLTRDVEHAARADERQRLAGLLSHGVDTLASVLAFCLARREPSPAMREFTAWLSGYVERRLHVVGWLLDHWDATPPLPPERVIDCEQAAATLARLQAVCAAVRDDRELRTRLHWDNGVLSQPGPDPAFTVDLDWPAGVEITCPVRGGFGLFLGEAVDNAMRHGAPGTVPCVEVRCDRARGELVFEVVNALAPHRADPSPQGEPYGGLRILAALARLSGWAAPESRRDGGVHRLRWTAPAGRRAAGEAD